MTWEEFSIALLELVGTRVTIDVLIAGSPVPVAGLQGVLLNVTEGHTEEDPTEQVTMAIRVRPQGSADTSYLHVIRPVFGGASWGQWGDKRTLEVRWHNFIALISPEAPLAT